MKSRIASILISKAFSYIIANWDKLTIKGLQFVIKSSTEKDGTVKEDKEMIVAICRNIISAIETAQKESITE